MSKVYLDLNMGSRDHYESEMAAYLATVVYCKKFTPVLFGEELKPEDLDDEQKESLNSYHSMDPEKDAGYMLYKEPSSLRVGRVEIELNESSCPKTCVNFKQLCTGEKGAGKIAKALHYKTNPIHRVVKGKLLQGGDITRFDGSGGESVWGKKFNDEKEGLKVKLEEPGLLCMANSGKNSNTSQYFLTIAPLPKLSGKHVVFGKVVNGMDVLNKIIEESSSEHSETPVIAVWVDDCGIL
eukprot:CFRG5652T1